MVVCVCVRSSSYVLGMMDLRERAYLFVFSRLAVRVYFFRFFFFIYFTSFVKWVGGLCAKLVCFFLDFSERDNQRPRI